MLTILSYLKLLCNEFENNEVPNSIK